MQVTREIVVAAPVEDVWDALTASERLADWFANDVELDAVPGGTGRFGWGDGTRREALVEDVEHQHALVFRWGTSTEDESRVAITLEQVEDGTRVTVTETALGVLARVGEWSGALLALALCVGTPALA
jgi:uncharacterized protein YndB with AHSA1/START domain